MSAFGGPNIITDGLVLSLDAGNTKSYPGSGTTWFDKSGNGNNGTLTNGPTFNSGNGGSIVFDGVDDYSSIPDFNSDTNLGLSVFAWVKLDTQNDLFLGIYYNWIINKRDGGAGANDMQWQLLLRRTNSAGFSTTVSTTILSGSSTVGSLDDTDSPSYSITLGNWYYVGFTTEGTNGGFLRTYQNGLLNDSTTLSSDRGTGNRPVIIGTNAWDLPGFLNWDGNIASTQIYNKALTSQEILQNYNATKTRFGL